MPTITKTTKRIIVAGKTPAAAAAPALTGVSGAPVGVVVTNAPPRTTTTQQCCCPACAGLECLDRTRFFSGQLLTEADLNNEQSYWLAKSRLHNRYLIGWGIVCGLQVSCSECNGWVNIAPGYAIDPCGNDIIVCSGQSFNVLKAIQACCAPSATPNCAPLRYSPPPGCQGGMQKWCITIQYQEQPSRMVTPLQQASSSGSSCSCGGTSKGGCGCGCGGGTRSSSNGSSTSTCGCSSAQTQTASTVPTGACEPTRIIEGFQIGIVAAPQTTEPATSQPGSFLYQIENCIKGLTQLAQMAPPNPPTSTDANAVYQLVCNYLNLVNQYFAQNQFVTHCTLLGELNTIAQSLLTPANGGTIASYGDALTSIGVVIGQAFKDCLCFALLPVCPPSPCDNRLILACVTVMNGVITDICPFEGRHQLIGYTALHYWLGSVFSGIGSLIDTLFERLCCGEKDAAVNQGFFPSSVAYDRTNITSDGISNPATLNRVFATLLAQKMGAPLLNVTSPQAQAVDLRPYIGQTYDQVGRLLKDQKLVATQVNVDQDPSWNSDAVAAASQFAPAAVSSGQPLTVYTKGQGNVVVGIEVTDPTTLLKNQVAALQTQIGTLQTQMNSMHSPGGTNVPSSKKK
jgi:hypothetical protein